MVGNSASIVEESDNDEDDDESMNTVLPDGQRMYDSDVSDSDIAEVCVS